MFHPQNQLPYTFPRIMSKLAISKKPCHSSICINYLLGHSAYVTLWNMLRFDLCYGSNSNTGCLWHVSRTMVIPFKTPAPWKVITGFSNKRKLVSSDTRGKILSTDKRRLRGILHFLWLQPNVSNSSFRIPFFPNLCPNSRGSRLVML